MSDIDDAYTRSQLHDIEEGFGAAQACAEIERDICLAWLDYMASQPTSALIAAMSAYADSEAPTRARERTREIYLPDLDDVSEEALPLFSPRHLGMRIHPSHPRHRTNLTTGGSN